MLNFCDFIRFMYLPSITTLSHESIPKVIAVISFSIDGSENFIGHKYSVWKKNY